MVLCRGLVASSNPVDRGDWRFDSSERPCREFVCDVGIPSIVPISNLGLCIQFRPGCKWLLRDLADVWYNIHDERETRI